jgi:56kDa selenium binding protein (SBP56)
MALLRPDPTFYPSPRLAMQAPPERLAYVAALNPQLIRIILVARHLAGGASKIIYHSSLQLLGASCLRAIQGRLRRRWRRGSPCPPP